VAQGDVGFRRQVQAQRESEAKGEEHAQEDHRPASHGTPLSA
jgi:hypothetical protein